MNHSQPNEAGMPDPRDVAPKAHQAPEAVRRAGTNGELTPVAAGESRGAASRTVESDEILQGARELLIKHERAVYRLRLTRNGKLILHK